MSKITELVSEMVKPFAEAEGCTLWDVEYVKEAGTWYLRIFVDKEGGVGIDDCERISRALDPVLDEKDPIPDSYVLEVGSPGCERELKRPSDFQMFLGSPVELKLYSPREGRKSFVGTLKSYDEGIISISVGNENFTFTKEETAQVRLHADF